tara:strand:- start:207 stop:617 length:411 start_codon:yes stop_codon:yes gene_type:complete
MSKVLDKAKSHFAEISNKGMESYEVPEWETAVYWKVGGLNFASQSAVIELQNAGKSADALVEMLIIRALDKDGNKMFSKMEKPVLMNQVDPNIILKIVTAMGETDKASDLGDPVGNSKRTQSSASSSSSQKNSEKA